MVRVRVDARIVQCVPYRVSLGEDFSVLITPFSIRRLALAAFQAVVPPLFRV